MRLFMRDEAQIADVHCPGCNRPMLVACHKPILFSDRLMMVTYRCAACARETMRTMKEPPPLVPLPVPIDERGEIARPQRTLR